MFKIRRNRCAVAFFLCRFAGCLVLASVTVYNKLFSCSTALTCKCVVLTKFHLYGIIVDFCSTLWYNLLSYQIKERRVGAEFHVPAMQTVSKWGIYSRR